MFQRILVPLDGSARAERAVLVAARLVRASGGTVILVQVANLHVEYGPYRDAEAGPTPVALDLDLAGASEYLKPLVQRDALACIATEKEVVSGPVAAMILAAAQAQRADLIVMSSHGRTGVTRWVLGSVAQKVIRHAPLPVLVLHDAGPVPIEPEVLPPLRALVPLDGSPLAEEAITPAAQLIAGLCAPARSEFHLLQVLDVAYVPFAQDHWAGEEYVRPSARVTPIDEARQYLEKLANDLHQGTLAGSNLSVTWAVTFNRDAAEGIIEGAAARDQRRGAEAVGASDMIAMATHGHGGLGFWTLGSVTERVLHATTLPLLVVRPQSALAQRQVGETAGESVPEIPAYAR
jgi:nucleotide-binding universal stress UspA family protein